MSLKPPGFPKLIPGKKPRKEAYVTAKHPRFPDFHGPTRNKAKVKDVGQDGHYAKPFYNGSTNGYKFKPMVR